MYSGQTLHSLLQRLKRSLMMELISLLHTTAETPTITYLPKWNTYCTSCRQINQNINGLIKPEAQKGKRTSTATQYSYINFFSLHEYIINYRWPPGSRWPIIMLLWFCLATKEGNLEYFSSLGLQNMCCFNSFKCRAECFETYFLYCGWGIFEFIKIIWSCFSNCSTSTMVLVEITMMVHRRYNQIRINCCICFHKTSIKPPHI